MRPRNTIVLIALALALGLLAGCGDSSDETGGETATAPSAADESPASSSNAPLGVRAKPCGTAAAGAARRVRVTGVGCAEGRRVAAAWVDAENCTIPAGASRGSCRVAGRVCLSVIGDQGVAVSCAKQGASVAFVARRSAARAS